MVLLLQGLREHRMTHGGGQIVIWQSNVFHRRARQQPKWESPDEPQTGQDFSDREEFGGPEESGVRFRPCVRINFFRCGELTTAC